MTLSSGEFAVYQKFQLSWFGYLRNEDGTTSIEYALIAILISMVVVTGSRSIGTSLNGIFGSVNNGFTGK